MHGLFGSCYTSPWLQGTVSQHEVEARQGLADHWASCMTAMHQVALSGLQAELVKNVDLTGKKRLLDVAGGAGSYSMTRSEEVFTIQAEASSPRGCIIVSKIEQHVGNHLGARVPSSILLGHRFD